MTTWIPLHPVLPWLRADADRSTFPAWLPVFSSILVFSPLLEGGTTHTAAMIIRLLALVLLCVWAWDVAKQGRLVVPSLAIGPPIAAFLLLAMISVAWSPYRHQSVQWLIVLVGDAGVLYVVACMLTTWRQVVWLLVLLAVVGMFEAGMALHQGWVQDAARPVGTFANPNFLGGYLAAVWCAVLGPLLHMKFRGDGGWAGIRGLGAAGLLCAGGVMLAAMFWTGSRGGLLAFAAGTAVTVFLRFGWKGLIAVALLIVVALGTPNSLSDRIRAEHTVNPAGYARLQMWQSAGRQMADHPFGIGLGLYQYLYPQYAFPIEGQVARYGKVAQTPHSELAQIGVELGVLALAVFCWGAALVVRKIRSVAALRLRRWQRGMVTGASGAVTSVLVHAVVDSNLHEPAVVIVLILGVAILFSVERLAGAATEEWTIPIHRPVLWGGVTVLAVALSAMLVVPMGVAWMAFEAGSRSLEQDDPERALEYLGQAVKLDPGKATYHNSLAAGHFQIFQRTREQAHLTVVVEELKEAARLNPLSAKPLKLLGDVYGVAAVEAASPERQRPWLLLGRRAYEQAVEREPFHPAHRLELGRLYLALGEGELAERSVRSAVDIEPNYLPGRFWLATRYARTGRLEPAKQEYEEIIRRQRYYADRFLEPYERGFLNVDVRELAALLERPRGEKPKKNRAL